MNNEQKENNNLNQNNSPQKAERSLADEEILRSAHEQKTLYERERIEWDIKKKQDIKEKLEMMKKNDILQKQISDLSADIETLKFKAVLEGSENFTSKREVPLTGEQESMRILAKVIRDTRARAEQNLAKKTDNIFYQ